MPVRRLCAVCLRPHAGSGDRCAEHQAARRRRPNRERRPDYNHDERKRRKAAVDAHRAVFGDWCPGWKRGPHASADLTADHILPVGAGGAEGGPLRVLCRPCNSARGARV